jgi:hypothetical protein
LLPKYPVPPRRDGLALGTNSMIGGRAWSVTNAEILPRAAQIAPRAAQIMFRNSELRAWEIDYLLKSELVAAAWLTIG